MEEEVSIYDLISRAIEDGLALEITYVKNSYDKSVRVISDISISDDYGPGYISAFCHKRNEDRTFKISRILDAHIVSMMAEENYEFNPNKPIFKLYGESY
ncbi:MAG: WYL domain-containing protein [Bacteroides heparinolyticus]|nr:WYL domain-containing protein [Bacteroides heparinolyticus]